MHSRHVAGCLLPHHKSGRLPLASIPVAISGDSPRSAVATAAACFKAELNLSCFESRAMSIASTSTGANGQRSDSARLADLLVPPAMLLISIAAGVAAFVHLGLALEFAVAVGLTMFCALLAYHILLRATSSGSAEDDGPDACRFTVAGGTSVVAGGGDRSRRRSFPTHGVGSRSRRCAGPIADDADVSDNASGASARGERTGCAGSQACTVAAGAGASR